MGCAAVTGGVVSDRRSRNTDDKRCMSVNIHWERKNFVVNCEKSWNTGQLKSVVAEKTGLPCENVKLTCCGKVLKSQGQLGDNIPLVVNNNNPVVVVCNERPNSLRNDDDCSPPSSHRKRKSDSKPSTSKRSDPPPRFLCPITISVMSDPVMSKNGVNYERKAILEWIRSGHKACPLTRETITESSLYPNRSLREEILEWRERHSASL